jgi:hypothetical protein
MCLDAANFLDFAAAAEHLDDDREAKTAGGNVKIRTGFVSFEIPQIGFEVKMVIVDTNKDELKAEVERRKKEEQKKKEEEPKKGEGQKKEPERR